MTDVAEARPRQQPLELGGPATWKDRRVPVEEIELVGLGAPPEDGLVASVGIHGVLVPILLDAGADGVHRVIDGRRRLAAAVMNGLTRVPARVMTGGSSALLDPAVTLAGNGHGSPNPIVELEAIEAIMREADGTPSAPAIARATGAPLKMIRARLQQMAGLRFELREGAREGAMTARTLLKAAACDEMQQAELVARLQANGRLTMDDVREVRKRPVREHQRTLPGDRKHARAVEKLEAVRTEIAGDLGAEHEAVQAVDHAIELLVAEDAE